MNDIVQSGTVFGPLHLTIENGFLGISQAADDRADVSSVLISSVKLPALIAALMILHDDAMTQPLLREPATKGEG